MVNGVKLAKAVGIVFILLLFLSSIIFFIMRGRGYIAKPPKAEKGEIAIVLDDFGYNMNNLDLLFEIHSPLTIAVLPNLPYSKTIAEEATERDFEVILHLPLEPYGEAAGLEKDTIMVGMQPQEIKNILAEAIASVPALKGVSNHMGSKATEDRELMKLIFKELRKRNFYFLDSVVTNRSVCRKVAKEARLRTAARSVFLDNELDEGYIEQQIFHAADLAAKTGRVIATGHDRACTIRVLAEVIPRLEKEGFKFVYVSGLVR